MFVYIGYGEASPRSQLLLFIAHSCDKRAKKQETIDCRVEFSIEKKETKYTTESLILAQDER